MGNILKIKHGASPPVAANLEDFELGYCTVDGVLYIKSNGEIKPVGGSSSPIATEITASSTNEEAAGAAAVYNFVTDGFVSKSSFDGKYLPLSGGTMTGDINFPAETGIRLHHSTDEGPHQVWITAAREGTAAQGFFYSGVITNGVVNAQLFYGYGGTVYYQYGGAHNSPCTTYQTELLHGLNFQNYAAYQYSLGEAGLYGVRLPDGTETGWLRAPTYGIVPNNSSNRGYVGSNEWPFGQVTSNLVRAVSSGDAHATSTAHAFQAGPTNGMNVRIDGNEILAINNGVNDILYLGDTSGAGVWLVGPLYTSSFNYGSTVQVGAGRIYFKTS